MYGKEIGFNGPADARAAGVSIIYQEPTLFPDLTVAENIFVGRQPLRGGRRIDRREMNKEAAEIFTRLGVALNPDRQARGLSVADQQIVEIAKALSFDAKVLVMDEPTAALTLRRGGAIVRGHAHIADARRRGAVHLPPAGGGVRLLPAGDRHARRPVRRAPRGSPT